MIHASTYMVFPFKAGFSPIFDSRGVIRGANPASKGARKWCEENVSVDDYGYGWTGYSQNDHFMFYFRKQEDLLAFTLKFDGLQLFN